jgi:hypothetical protein
MLDREMPSTEALLDIAAGETGIVRQVLDRLTARSASDQGDLDSPAMGGPTGVAAGRTGQRLLGAAHFVGHQCSLCYGCRTPLFAVPSPEFPRLGVSFRPEIGVAYS